MKSLFFYFRTGRIVVLVGAGSAVLGGTSVAAVGQVTVQESVVRLGPFEVAPELTRVHLGDRLSTDDDAKDGWRHVRLPDGRNGFVPSGDLEIAQAMPAAGPGGPTPPQISLSPTVAAPRPSAAVAPAEGERVGSAWLGVMFEALPAGALRLSSTSAAQTSNASKDIVTAFALSPFVDITASPHLSVGLSPQVIFHVKGEGATGEAATELDLRLRFTGRLPISPTIRAFGRLSPGYSIIVVPSPPVNMTTVSNPTGLQVDLAVGAEITLAPNFALVVDTGYQLGFQSSSNADQSSTFDGTSYLHLGIGLAIRL